MIAMVRIKAFSLTGNEHFLLPQQQSKCHFILKGKTYFNAVLCCT